MFNFFIKTHENNIFSYLKKFEKEEKELLSNFQTISGEWFISKQIEQRIQKFLIPAINEFEINLNKLNREESFKIEKNLNSKVNKLESKINKLIKQIQRNIKELKKRPEKEILIETYQIMKLFIDDLHQFILQIKYFPFNKIDHYIQNKILEDLRKKRIFLPDIDFFKATEMIKNYTEEELMLVLQYQSLEKPYLFITKDTFGNINRFIVKSMKTSNKFSNKNFLISKLLGYFEIRNYGVKYEFKYYENLQKYELKEFISFVEGDCLINNKIFTNREEIIKYAYFLGSSIAEGYFIGLSDRLVNIHYSPIDFNKIDINNMKKYLGIKNPIFHIDYDFAPYNSIEQYFTDIIFRSSDSLYEDLLYQKINLNQIDINIVRIKFNEGFLETIEKLKKVYMYNKNEIDSFLLKTFKNLNMINRLNDDNIEIYKNYEKEKFEIFKSKL